MWLMKISLLLILMLSSLVILSACTGVKTQTLEECYKDTKIKNVDNVTIQDGTTGGSETFTEQEQINEFFTSSEGGVFYAVYVDCQSLEEFRERKSPEPRAHGSHG